MGSLIVGVILVLLSVGLIWFLSAEYFYKIGSFVAHLTKPFTKNYHEEENKNNE